MVKKPRFWKSLPKEDKKGVVRALLEAGYTREAIGKALGTTKNAVVGFQHSQLSDMTGKFSGTIEEVPAQVLSEMVAREWPIEGASSTSEEDSLNTDRLSEAPVSKQEPSPQSKETGDEQRTASRNKPKYRIATDWRNQCAYKDGEGHQCAYEKQPGMERCKLHA